MKTQDRFWQKVNKTESCWLWTGAKARGYGHFRLNGRSRTTHRLAWEWANGRIPEDLEIDHLCRIRHCVNPDHMELVTTRENILRGVGPTAQNARKTACKRGHPFTPKNTWVRKNGQRRCRICHRILKKRYRERKRAGVVPVGAGCMPGAYDGPGEGQ